MQHLRCLLSTDNEKGEFMPGNAGWIKMTLNNC
jgi:hypothetical protein